MLGKLLQGRYQVVQVLSTGEFYQTYIAQDTHLSDHPSCIVKHFLPANTHPDSLQTLRRLFIREVEALKKLGNNDQVPKLLDHFEENQEFYLVQEFIAGHPLSEELPPPRYWTEGEVVQMLQEVLGILEFVHSHGLIHRDIKPNNLIRRQQDGRLVLIDFSSVKQAWTQVVTAQGQTNASFALGSPATIAIGTPGYMPTEQGRGRPRPNSDIYALGIIGIQALTGLNPDQLLEDSDTGEIIWQHQAKVSLSLANVLNKMVRYHFKDRYQEAKEVLQALEPLAKLHPPTQETVVVGPSSGKAPLQPSLTATPVPQNPPSGSDTIPVFRGNRAQPRSRESTSDDLATFPNKTAVLIGIGIGVACALALIIGVYYSRRSPAPASKTQQYSVSIPTKNTSLNTSPAQTLTGHSDVVWSVALSPDGENIVSGSGDKTIKVWNLHTGQLLRTLSGHSSQVVSVAISPCFERSNQQTLTSGSYAEQQAIKIWNLHTGELLRTLSGNSNKVWSVAITCDGDTLVSSSGDKTIKIWNLHTGSLQGTLYGHSDTVWSLAISPYEERSNQQILVSGSMDHTIKIWDLPNKALRRTLIGHSGRVRSVAISPDGQTLASGSWDRTIKIWNLPTGKLLHTLFGHSGYVNTVAISPDGQIIASGSDDYTIKLWNLHTGSLLRTLSGHSNNVNSVAFNADGKILVSGSGDKTIKIWRL